MREPVALPSTPDTVRPHRPRRKPAKGARRRARPRRGVPGGKALARLNMFLRQRGIAPEPAPPPPPSLPEAPAAAPRSPRAAPAATEGPAQARGLVAGFRELRGQLDAPAADLPVWRPLGPYFIPHGQSYGSGPGSRPPVAGRVAAVAVDPVDDRHVLCGAAGGGVWETHDGGVTWAPRGDEQPSLSIGALVFDPGNPLRVYAGTGEGNTARSNTGNIRAAGLLVSDDGGTTWSVMPGSTFLGISFFDLVIDPEDPDHLLAATTNGLYETLDGGGAWHRRRAALTWSLSLHPPVPTNPAAGREVLAGCVDGLWRSTNGGTTWTRIPLAVPAGAQLERVEARHAPSNGSVAYVFAAGPPLVLDPVSSSPGFPVRMPKPYLWRREVLGGAWAAVPAPPDLQTGQAWYDWFAAVAPNNPDVLYVGAINVHRGIRQAGGSWSWTNIGAKGPTGDSVHPDQHAIAFGPSDASVIYVGNDGGLSRSPDAGVTWEHLGKGLSITEVEFLAGHPDYDGWLLAGTQDNGTLRYEGQQTWYHVQDGDGGDCGVHAGDPYVCFHSFYGPHVERSLGGGAWNDWRGVTPRTLDEEDALFYPPLEVNGELVVRGATQVWLSRRRGDPGSWRAVAMAWPPTNQGAELVSSLTAPTGDRVFAGGELGSLSRLDWDGERWEVTDLASPDTGYVSDLVVDPTDPDGLWCSLNTGGRGRVQRSTDGGVSWDPPGDGLPAGVAVHALEIDPADSAVLFAATDVGVFRTADGGASWTAFGRGLPNVLVKDLLLHAATRLLRAGTQARGVWEVAIDGPATADVEIYLRDHAADTARSLPSPDDVPNPFTRGTNLFWWQSPDLKIDASPFAVTDLDGLDFDLYSDDRSKEEDGLEFAAGLEDERPVRGQRVRVYVQVHNRGAQAAEHVAVRVFAIPGGVTWPDLPATFWDAFPDNVLPTGSPWRAVAPHRVVPRIAVGRSAVVGFDWTVPASLGTSVGLLAIASSALDPVPAGELSVPELVRGSRHCALRNLAVINPGPLVGPSSPTLLLDVWPAPEATLELDREARALVRGVVLGKGMAAAARKAGWKPLKPSRGDSLRLRQLVDARPDLKQKLDVRRAWRQPAAAAGLAVPARGREPEPIVLLLKRRESPSSASVVVRRGGAPCGGVTIVDLAASR